MAHEAPGQTLQPTALVHEAWLRLVGQADQSWQNRRHCFSAAAEAMRRILIERARRRRRRKHGGGLHRVDVRFFAGLSNVDAAELQRCLDHTPVTAVAPTLTHQLVKLYRRNRKEAAIVLVCATLLRAAWEASGGGPEFEAFRQATLNASGHR